jgi:metal-responsive CopG/Arc/MetJ family transcriptional regulator
MELGQTIYINIEEEMADEIERRADSMYLSASEYVMSILIQWVESEKELELQGK